MTDIHFFSLICIFRSFHEEGGSTLYFFLFILISPPLGQDTFLCLSKEKYPKEKTPPMLV